MQPEIFLYVDRCTRCGQCVAVCSTGATDLSGETSTIDRSKCIGCGRCAEVCLNEARKLVGKHMTVDEVMAEVLKDRVFYENSGGGVTLSGGEPTAQPDFTLAVLRNCKEEGLHIVLDTCGYVSWSTMERLLEYVDLVYYDIKCIDAEKHSAATGLRNDIILDNAKRIARYKPMRVRVPLVPGFNDSKDEIEAIAHFVKAEIGSLDMDLLSYNKMGEGKYRPLDRRSVHLVAQSEEYLQSLRSIVDASH